MGACMHIDTVACENCRPDIDQWRLHVQRNAARSGDYIDQLQRTGILATPPSATDRHLEAIEKDVAALKGLLERVLSRTDTLSRIESRIEAAAAMLSRRGNVYEHFPLSGEACHCGGRAVRAVMERKDSDEPATLTDSLCAWCLAEAAHAAGLTVIGRG